MMLKYGNHADLRFGVLALAVLAAFPATAQQLDPERAEAVAAATETQNTVRIGLGYLSDPGRRFGLYSGIRDQQAYVSADADLVRLDKTTGTWLTVQGRDLGLESRELLVDYARQGAWRLQFGYGRLTRFEPMVVNTGLSGIESTSVTVNGTSIRPVDLQMSRDLFNVGASFSFDKANTIRLRFTHEEKTGGRLFGRGTISSGAGALANAAEFLVEPIDRTTQTLELTYGHVGRTMQVSAGYYGTLFFNHGNRLDVSSSAVNALAQTAGTPAVPPFTPMSMPLSNNSHQLFVTAGYSLTPLTRASFKASQTIARQNENLISVAPLPTLAGAPASLDGRVDTTLAYLDLTSMEIDRIDLQANLRYEDRDDKTPERQFMSSAAPAATNAGVTGFNKPRSWTSLRARLEAGLELPDKYKLVASVENDHQKRNSPELFRKVNFRTETDESTLRLEAKRPILDVLSGSVSYQHARRTGSSYQLDTYTGTSADPANSVNPLLFADRDRGSWKAMLDWMPSDEWTVHIVRETARDHYTGMALGPRDGKRFFTSVDAGYALSERWRAHFWWSRDDAHADQATRTGTLQFWQANIRQLTEGIGAGIQGRTRGGIEVGLDASYSEQGNQHRMSALSGAPINSLPDYVYRLLEVKAFGVYPLDQQSGVRAEYAYADWRTDDWTWNGWTYSDGTTLSQDYGQRTHFVGASYYYRWR